jgi:DNA repair exonuclease SbcCD ATPase subunit
MLLASITSNEKESNLLDSTITRHINLVSFLDKEEGCSSCGYIDPEQKKKLKETKKEESDFRKRKKECEKEIIRDKKKYDSINLDISASDLDVLSKITSTTKHLNYLKETKKRHQREINKLKKDLLKYKKRYEILRFWEKAFSEKGLIKYIIRNILGYLNGQSNYYVSFLSQQFYMNLKDDLSIDIFQGAVKKDYNILSGGERRRLDLAITLALNDLTATVNNSSSNIVFFDEAVENLDKEGIKGFSTLLESIAKNKKLFIITHSQYLTELLHKANTIKVKKKKGKTSI